MAEDREIEQQDFGAVLASELRQARGYDDAELNGKRTKAIEYMRGEMRDVPSRPNGSQQTDRTVADTISWIKPGIIRVFTASDQMVQYDKVRAENDEWSREATEYTNYSFFRENDGYGILYNATDDALKFGNGLASSYWEPERVESKTFRDKTEMELAALLDEGWQPTGVVKPGRSKADLVDDGVGDYVETEVPTLTVKLQKVERKGRICDKSCKPENLLIDTTAVTIEDARFVGYLHDDVTRSDLMEMANDYGWDKEVIENLPRFNRVTDSEVQQARDANRPVIQDSTVKSGDIIGLYECYIRADKDGDGIAELLQAWWAGDIGGGQMLGEPEEWEDDVPYTDIPCYPVPHSFVAESVFDRTEDIQRVKTVLTRGLLDNLYAVALPMREAEAASVLNPDILANPKFGATIWRKQGSMQSAPIVDHVIPFIGDKILAGLQYLDEQVSKRTGVSRTTMALDPEALQNQTATASQQQRDAGYSQIELIARNMAEKGWAKFFQKRLKLAQRHGLVAEIPSKSEEAQDGFRQIDASKWDANMAVSINVGLGTGSRDRDMAMMQSVLMDQIGMADRLTAAGVSAKAIEFMPKIRMAAVKKAESAGLKNPEEYYPEITEAEIETLKQSVEDAKKQPPLEVQLKQMDVEATAKTEQLKAEGNAAKEQLQLQADLQTGQMDRQNELILEEKRQQIQREEIASRERIEYAKLEQQRELEILKLNAVEVEENESETGPDGKPKSGKKTKRRIVDNNQALMEGLKQLAAMMSAPVEIVRDANGRATGTKRQMN